MGKLLDTFRDWLGPLSIPDNPVQARHGEHFNVSEAAVRALSGGSSRLYTPATISEAIGVPAIQSAVQLIVNTAASLQMQGFREKALMDPTPRLLSRPDPHEIPFLFFRDTYFSMAVGGEYVWYIAARDMGLAASLVNVPLHELKVEENPNNRLLPRYQWGDIVSTRWSPANPDGKFVHGFYARAHRFALRGVGPLQMCGAAVSVAVEAQDWAANFFADGGNSHTVLHAEGSLSADDEDDAEFENEAKNLLDQWNRGPNNTTKVVDDAIREISYHDTDTGSAQMLQGRDYSNGEAARMYGIQGSLLDYSASGSSIQYTNLETEFLKFLKTCLQPRYLEPVEQQLTDLLPRGQVARADVDGFLRAETKTRWEVYNQMVPVIGQQEAARIAREDEGIDPGNPEVAPVPFAPPTALPSSVPTKEQAQLPAFSFARVAAEVREVRCDGMTQKRRSGIPRLERCNALLSKNGTFTGKCRRCKKEYAAVA